VVTLLTRPIFFCGDTRESFRMQQLWLIIPNFLHRSTREQGCQIKWSLNIPTFTIQRPTKIYPNLEFLIWKQTIWQPCARAFLARCCQAGRHVKKHLWTFWWFFEGEKMTRWSWVVSKKISFVFFPSAQKWPCRVFNYPFDSVNGKVVLLTWPLLSKIQ
jgi:hypothetical protein